MQLLTASRLATSDFARDEAPRRKVCRAAAGLDAGARSVGSVVRRARDGRGAFGLGVGVTRARLEGVRRAFRPVAAAAARIGAVVVIPSSD
jgi:hypothetical protein